MATFTSDGRPIRLDHYLPRHPGSSPAVILIHGSGGPLHGLDPFAGQAANFGVHVFVLHYFERTGHNWVAPSQIEQNFLVWLETLKELFGGLPEPFTNAAGNLPPVLILHGAQDTIVPVEQAYRLVRILQRHKISYQIKIYLDQGHVFKGLAQLDAMGRVAQFFMAYLLKAA